MILMVMAALKLTAIAQVNSACINLTSSYEVEIKKYVIPLRYSNLKEKNRACEKLKFLIEKVCAYVAKVAIGDIDVSDLIS